MEHSCLLRYNGRVVISNRRSIEFDKSGITIRYKDYRRKDADRQRGMTLDPNEFIRNLRFAPTLRSLDSDWTSPPCLADAGSCGEVRQALTQVIHIKVEDVGARPIAIVEI